jgi:hypothetical protein
VNERASLFTFAREEWIGPPEPEVWRKVDGYEDGQYAWAVATDDKIKWFTTETAARSYFRREVRRRV